jgi:hypothetical protein
MIVLTGTSDILRVVTSAAAALDVHCSFVDNTAATYTPGRQNTAITTATTTTVLAAPAAATQRGLKKLSAVARGGANTVTVEYFDGSTATRLVSVAPASGETLEYEDAHGWRVLTVDGAAKGVGAQGASGAAGPTGPTGDAGVAGATGATGGVGPIGLQGIPGNDGDPGPPGEQAAPGLLTLGVIPDGLLTNAKLFPMGEGNILGRALGAGTGSPQYLTGAEVAAILALRPPFVADYVSTLGLASSVLRVANAAYDDNGVSSLPDLLNTNPAVQTVSARRPHVGASANGLPILTFDGGDVLLWPLTAANNNDNTLGFACWVKPVTVAAGDEILFSIEATTGGASANKMSFYRSGSTLLFIIFKGAAVLFAQTAAATLTAGAWHFVTGEYHSGLATDAVRFAITVGAAVKTTTISGTATGAMTTATGSAFIGARSNDATPLGPMLNGSALGPNIYTRVSAMAGVTEGVWTPAARASLMAIEAPT